MISSMIEKLKVNKFLFILLSAMVIFAACEGPAGPEGPAGQDGSDGANGVDGEDGNANVTVYIFDGHDFSATSEYGVPGISGLTETEMVESSWDVYMLNSGFYYHVPGFGSAGLSEYRVYHDYDSGASEVTFQIGLESGTGETYSEVRIVRAAANNVEDNTTSKVSGSAEASDRDFSSYQELVEYYNITQDDIVDMRSK